MGQEQLHGTAYDQRFYCTPETTYGTWVRATATTAYKALSLNISSKRNQENRMDNRPTRSAVERILKEWDITWNTKAYICASGSAGTAPDIGQFLIMALGVETVDGGVSVTYSPSSTQGALGSATLHRWSQVAMLAAVGAAVDEWEIDINGTDFPYFTASGFAASLVHTGCSTLDAAMVADDQMDVQTADVNNFMTNSVVQVAALTNTGVGYRVTEGTNPFTLESAISASDEADVVPFAPTETTAGTPMSGIDGGLTIDSVSTIPFTSLKLRGKNNLSPHRFALNPTIQDYTEGWREVTGEYTVLLRRDQVIRFGNILNAMTTNSDIAVAVGTTAGAIMTLNIDRARHDLPEINFPEGAEVAEIPFNFTALASAATASDECSIVFT